MLDAKPLVKHVEGFDPPRYAVALGGTVKTLPTTWTQAMAEAWMIVRTNAILHQIFGHVHLHEDDETPR